MSADAEETLEDEETRSGSSWVRAVFVVGVLALGVGLILLGESAPDQLTRGSTAPSFTLPRLPSPSEDAEQIAPTLSLDELRGQVVMLNFWATWCKPCEEEIPSMERLYEKLGLQEFELVAVSVDEDPAPVREFQERMGITFPILLDPSQKTSKLYQLMGFPETLLVDRDGTIVERYVGPRDWDHPSYAERILSLLSSDRG